MPSRGEINSKKILVKDIFSQMWFRIPEYQRPYVWGREEIDDLLDDLSFALFVCEEAIQSSGFGIFVVQSIRRHNEETLEAWETQLDFTEALNEKADAFRKWSWPCTWIVNHAFAKYFEATRRYVHQQRVRLAVEKAKWERRRR